MIVILVVCLAMAFILADKKTRRMHNDLSNQEKKEKAQGNLLEQNQVEEDTTEDEEFKKELFRTPYDRTYGDGTETYINEKDRRFK